MPIAEASTDRGRASLADLAPISGHLDVALHPALSEMVLDLVAASHVGVCVCDENDQIRYFNEAWKSAVFPTLADGPIRFPDALEDAIIKGNGVKLHGASLKDFIPRVRNLRKAFVKERNISVDLADGRWWWIGEYKLPNGWTIGVGADISSVKHEEFRLREAHAAAVKDAHTDVLTGIPNRRCGLERAEAALTQARDHGWPLALAVLDIDRFKWINDQHGHDVGDAVLVSFARVLDEAAQPDDVVSRIGGEEFLVVLRDKSSSEAKCHLEALLRNLRPLNRHSGLPCVPYSFSAGVVSAAEDSDLKSLMTCADSALYRAKVSGRSRVEVWQAA